MYTLQQDKCICKNFGHVSVNDLHLHWIYTLYIQLLTLTCTTLVWTNICLVYMEWLCKSTCI